MTPFASLRALLPLFLGASVLAGCSGSILTADTECKGSMWIESRLFFGRNISGGGQVTDEMWRDFVDKAIVSRFHDGFTVVDGVGFWLDEKNRRTGSERSKILVVLHPEDSTIRQRLDEIAKDYIATFDQQAVLADSQSTCVVFHQSET